MLSLQYDHYYRYDELTAFLQTAAEEYPHLARLQSIGQSWQGREIWLLEISNRQIGDPARKPAMYIEGNMHAGEVTGCAVCQHTIWHLLTHYGTDPEVTRLLDTRTFYVNPRVSPDGAEQYLTTPHSLRSSVRPYSDPEEAGLLPADIDGDGLILQMRWPDPTGDWKVSPSDPRLMVHRLPSEQSGQFYRLLPEGTIRDYRPEQEVAVARSAWSLDFNRNYPANWAPESEQRGAGPYPLSEPETRAVVDFLLAHQNVAGIMSYHTSGGVILRPYSTKDDQSFPGGDLRTYRILGNIAKEITGYDLIGVFGGLNHGLPSHGDLKDWAYEHYGVFVFTTELWDVAAAAGADPVDWSREPSEAEREQRWLQLLRWQDREFGGDAFVSWRRYLHPQLGEVELGGWKVKQYLQNPPAGYLAAECEKNAAFTFKHALLSPLLRIQKVTVSKCDGELWQIAVAVANEGFLPTNITEQAIRAKVAKSVQLMLQPGPEVELIDCGPAVNLGHLAGWSRAQASWLVRGPAGSVCTVQVSSPKAGCDAQIITLG